MLFDDPQLQRDLSSSVQRRVIERVPREQLNFLTLQKLSEYKARIERIYGKRVSAKERAKEKERQERLKAKSKVKSLAAQATSSTCGSHHGIATMGGGSWPSMRRQDAASASRILHTGALTGSSGAEFSRVYTGRRWAMTPQRLREYSGLRSSLDLIKKKAMAKKKEQESCCADRRLCHTRRLQKIPYEPPKRLVYPPGQSTPAKFSPAPHGSAASSSSTTTMMILITMERASRKSKTTQNSRKQNEEQDWTGRPSVPSCAAGRQSTAESSLASTVRMGTVALLHVTFCSTISK